MMEERSLHIVIVGHVDHGKSTLIGRLFYDTGCLSEDKIEEIKRASDSMGKEIEFAFIMDHLEEERSRGITIDIAHTFFNTEKRRYVIIDAPGHKEFLKNMISGSSQAEAALLLVDIHQGIQEQTRRHCYILSLLGIRQVAVLVNKMDMVGYSEQGFKDISAEIKSLLAGLKITPSYIIPISARLGDNVAKKTDPLSWHQGPTVLEALDSFESLKIEEKSFRLPVQDIYELEGGPVAVGRVESGVIKKGMEVELLPCGDKRAVTGIMKFMEEEMTEAAVGECIGVRLTGETPTRGQVIVDEATCTVTDKLRANIFWMVNHEYSLGIPLLFRCATQAVPCKIGKIFKRFDPATVEIVEKDAGGIKPAEIAEVEINLTGQVAVDKFSEIPEMGRFILEHDGHPVAGGIIL
jgi:translation elongation factor TU